MCCKRIISPLFQEHASLTTAHGTGRINKTSRPLHLTPPPLPRLVQPVERGSVVRFQYRITYHIIPTHIYIFPTRATRKEPSNHNRNENDERRRRRLFDMIISYYYAHAFWRKVLNRRARRAWSDSDFLFVCGIVIYSTYSKRLHQHKRRRRRGRRAVAESERIT